MLGCNFKGLLSQLLDMKIMLPEFIEKLHKIEEIKLIAENIFKNLAKDI